MVSHLLGWAVMGLVAGALARLLHPGRDPMNWVWTMLLGIGGAVAGGYLGDAMGFDARNGLMGWVTAIAGAVILLVLYHMATAGRALSANSSAGATNDDYKKAVFDDLSRGPNG